jgi:hypothetical protein
MLTRYGDRLARDSNFPRLVATIYCTYFIMHRASVCATGMHHAVLHRANVGLLSHGCALHSASPNCYYHTQFACYLSFLQPFDLLPSAIALCIFGYKGRCQLYSTPLSLVVSPHSATSHRPPLTSVVASLVIALGFAVSTFVNGRDVLSVFRPWNWKYERISDAPHPQRYDTIRFFGREMRVPNTTRFRNGVVSRFLWHAPFVMEIWYWSLMYWVSACFLRLELAVACMLYDGAVPVPVILGWYGAWAGGLRRMTSDCGTV